MLCCVHSVVYAPDWFELKCIVVDEEEVEDIWMQDDEELWEDPLKPVCAFLFSLCVHVHFDLLLH